MGRDSGAVARVGILIKSRATLSLTVAVIYGGVEKSQNDKSQPFVLGVSFS